MNIFICIVIGAFAGVLGGALGIGGGLVMVPLLVSFFGLTQHQAQGTVITAMLPPVLLLAALQYYYAGNVKIQIAVFMSVGFVIGAFIGGKYVQGMPADQLKKIFGIVLVVLGLRMVFLK